MLEMFKKSKGPRFKTPWIAECPHCFAEVEFISVSPQRCEWCKQELPNISGVMKQKQIRVEHFRGNGAQHEP